MVLFRSLTTIQRRKLSTILRRQYHSSKNVHPFSASFPSPGHQWCELCQIHCHKFEKPIGVRNACIDYSASPSLSRMCPAARQYYLRQCSYMIFLGLVSFVALPGVTFDLADEPNDVLGSNQQDPPKNDNYK